MTLRLQWVATHGIRNIYPMWIEKAMIDKVIRVIVQWWMHRIAHIDEITDAMR